MGQQPYKWLPVSDFTPGIISNSDLLAGTAVYNGSVPGSKPGQAQNAVGCIALPNGGLAPLPGIKFSVAPVNPISPLSDDLNMIVGFFVNGPINQQAFIVASGTVFPGINADEIVVGQMTYIGADFTSELWIDSYQIAPAPFGITSQQILDTTPLNDGAPMMNTMTGGTTRVNPTDPEAVGLPVWALDYWLGAPGTGLAPATYPGTFAQILYPDPNETFDAETFVPFVLNDTYPAQVICHQNRIVLLQRLLDPYPQTAAPLNTIYGGLSANEAFNYTEPPNSAPYLPPPINVSNVTLGFPGVISTAVAHGLVTGEEVTITLVTGTVEANGTWVVTVIDATDFSIPVNLVNAWTGGGLITPLTAFPLGLQQETFVQEAPNGYGAWGSISAAELFLVKNGRGGVVISGDLNSPQVTWLPGVTSTYGLMSRAAMTPIGMVYASQNRGLWVWNGGNTSTKLSNALDDNFAQPVGLPPVIYGPTVDICTWGDWIICTNDWLYDTNLGGWWKLPPGQGAPHQWFGTSYDASTLYAAVGVPTTDYFMDIYQRGNELANEWTWKSTPIRLDNDTANVNYVVREVVIRAQGVGTIDVTVTGIGGSSSDASPSESATFGTTDQPIMHRMTLGNTATGGGLVAQDVTIELSARGTRPPELATPAPILYSVAIGYEEQNPVNRT